MHRTVFVLIVAALCTLASLTAVAWQVDGEYSEISYVSSKRAGDAAVVMEVNRFKTFNVSAQDDMLVLTIDLNSIDTGIEVRDGRLKEHLFDTGKHPRAIVRVPMAVKLLEALKPGQLLDWDGQVELAVGDESVILDARLNVVALNQGEVLITSSQPILVSADSFGWLEGLATLKKLAGLSAIGETVPVSVRLKLQPVEATQ